MLLWPLAAAPANGAPPSSAVLVTVAGARARSSIVELWRVGGRTNDVRIPVARARVGADGRVSFRELVAGKRYALTLRGAARARPVSFTAARGTAAQIDLNSDGETVAPPTDLTPAGAASSPPQPRRPWATFATFAGLLGLWLVLVAAIATRRRRAGRLTRAATRASSALSVLLLLIALGGCSQRSRTAPAVEPCLSCHTEDRSRAKQPDHLKTGFPSDCQDCHTQKEWSPAAWDHRGFPLLGGHSTAACADCHENEPVPKICVGCHEDDRKTPKSPNHLADGFPTACENCHTILGWKPAANDHSKFPLVGAHSAAACSSCHDKEPVPTTCIGCHADDRPKDTTPDHLADGFPEDCAKCHDVKGGWEAAVFDHDQRYPLVGKHSTTPCASCHDKDPVPLACVGCHDADRKTPVEPNHLAAGFSTKCETCHSVTKWKPAAVDHSKFPLTGKHLGLGCNSCHDTTPAPNTIATTCIGCHEQDRKKPTEPDHLDPGFPEDCRDCHTTADWKPSAFDHNKFPLEQGHATVGCFACHEVEPVPDTCVGCHADERKQVTEPDHLAAGFSDACETCHNLEAWTPAAPDHSKFPLSGIHSPVGCNDCHNQDPVPTTCAGCHDADRPTGTKPDHQASGFPPACEDCHDTVSTWTGATFDHDANYPLVGKHSTAPCSSCHDLVPLPKDCAGCHRDDRPQGANPDHFAAGFKTSCDDCHLATAWKPAQFDHTKFPLTGAHGGVACASCHATDPPPKTCVGCHESDRATPKLPNHLDGSIPTTCDDCHNTAAWKPAAFDHTKFPLQGGHGGVGCESCHKVEPVPNTCVGCHLTDRSKPTNPSHLTAGFSTACETCHNIQAWKPASVDHSKFPLTGVHSAVACSDCHNVDPVPNTCATCHAADRPTGTIPDHMVAGFPTACQDCHDTKTPWTGATFDHDGYYPLVGKHSTATCSSCHDLVPLPKTCVGCHDADRSTPTNPNHLGAGFSTDCKSCHLATAWKPAQLDHTKFPLSGAHSGTACENCHDKDPVPTTCVGCHDGDRSTPTVPNHLDASIPTTCDDCHSTAAWKPASFDHTKFPLSGGHSGVGCQSCHKVEPVPTTCVGCHDANRSTPTNPNHLASGFSTNCNNCHTINAWKPAAVDHSKYPLTGKHSAVTCNACHDKNPVPTTCVGCHNSDRSTSTVVDHLATGFSTACDDCHNTNTWVGASIDHDQYYPLVGKHSTATCGSCHDQSPVPTVCSGCHLADRPTGATPDHRAGGFNTKCDDCHLATAWKPAEFDHSAYPLTGAHSGVTCQSCHDKDPVPTTCNGCHAGDVRSGIIPDHKQSGFSSACQDCHTTNAWTPASFDHEQYWHQISAHRKACNNCHSDPADYKKFSCFIGCHKHTISGMDSKHKGRSGYVSGDSNSCLKSGCHADGRK